MAVAFVRAHGNQFVKTAGTTQTYTLSAAVPAGNVLIMVCVTDNAAAAFKPAIAGGTSITKPAGDAAVWENCGAVRYSAAGTAGAFSCGEMYRIMPSVEWPAASSFTVTWDTSITMKSMNVLEFSGVEAFNLRNTFGAAGSTTTTAASATTTGTTPVIGDLAIGLLYGSNVAAAQAGDTDTTGGSWSTPIGVGSTGGSTATNNFGVFQYKILTAASHQTFNNSAAMTAGNGAIVAILRATIEPRVTQAAYRFYEDGTETGSTALAAQDTAPEVDTSSSDVNVQLRMRLQETAGGVVPATDDWRLQWEKNTSGAWANVTGSAAEVLVDSYSETNASGTNINIVSGDLVGQSFLGNGTRLARGRFYLARGTTGPETMSSVLYAHTGSYGSGNGTGSELAVSTERAGSALTPSAEWQSFDFDQSVTLATGTPYVIGVMPGGTANNGIYTSLDNTSPTHSGNASRRQAGVWQALGSDLVFEVYGMPVVGTAVPYDSPNLLPDAAVASEQLTDNANDTIGKTGGQRGIGQSFLGDGRLLTRAAFKLSRFSGSVNVGPVWAELYAHTGTYGSFGAPTGPVLATSTSIDSQTDIPALGSSTGTWCNFVFDSTVTLTNGTPYVIAVRAVGLGAGANDGVFVRGNSGNAHPGNLSAMNASSVWAGAFNDTNFQVFTTGLVQATTNRLGAGTGSFVAGKVSEDGLVDDLGWAASSHTEVLYSITLKQADLAPSDTLRFRVLKNGATTDLTYTAYPSITIGAGGPATIQAVVALTASSTLSTTAVPERAAAVALSATSTLSVTGTVTGAPVTVEATAALSATSTLTATAFEQAQGAVSLFAASTLTTTAIRFGVLQATVPLTAASTLTVAAVRQPQASVSLVAGSTLTVAAVRSAEATASLSAASTLTASATTTAAPVITAAVALTGVSALSVSATVTAAPVITATVALAASSTLTATGTREPQASVSLTAASTLNATAERVRPAVVSLSATSTLTATGTPIRAAAVPLAAASTLTVTGVRASVATVAFTAVSTLSATAVREPQAAVSLVAASTLTATGLRTSYPTVGLVAASTLTVAAVPVRPAAVPLTATSTLTVTAIAIGASAGVAALIATSTLTTAATRTTYGTVSLTATALLTVQGVRVRPVAVSLSATSTLTATPTRIRPAVVPLVGVATLTVTAVRSAGTAVGMVATATLTAVATTDSLAAVLRDVARTGYLHALDTDMHWYPVTTAP